LDTADQGVGTSVGTRVRPRPAGGRRRRDLGSGRGPGRRRGGSTRRPMPGPCGRRSGTTPIPRLANRRVPGSRRRSCVAGPAGDAVGQAHEHAGPDRGGGVRGHRLPAASSVRPRQAGRADGHTKIANRQVLRKWLAPLATTNRTVQSGGDRSVAAGRGWV